AKKDVARPKAALGALDLGAKGPLGGRSAARPRFNVLKPKAQKKLIGVLSRVYLLFTDNAKIADLDLVKYAVRTLTSLVQISAGHKLEVLCCNRFMRDYHTLLICLHFSDQSRSDR